MDFLDDRRASDLSEVMTDPTDGKTDGDKPRSDKYVPLSEVDRRAYDIMTAEEAAVRLGLTSRTIYRQQERGERLWTVEKGIKRFLVPKASDRSDDVSEVSEERTVVSVPSSDDVSALTDRMMDLTDRVLSLTDQLEKKDKTIQERDQAISGLNNQIAAAHAAIQRRNLPEVIDLPGKQKDVLPAEIEKLTRLVEEQQAEIQALKNRPWWRRWLGG